MRTDMMSIDPSQWDAGQEVTTRFGAEVVELKRIGRNQWFRFSNFPYRVRLVPEVGDVWQSDKSLHFTYRFREDERGAYADMVGFRVVRAA